MKKLPQEQLSSLRRNQILDAAGKLFATKGFHPTTTKDVAREAGLAEGTIYIYFKNKPALLLGIMERMQSAALQNIDASRAVDMDLTEFISTYIQHPLTVFQASNFELFKVVVSEILVNQELREHYYEQLVAPTIGMGEAFFQQWAEQHGMAPIHTKLLMHTLSSLVIGLIVQRIIGDSTLEAEWDHLPTYISELLLHGIGGSQQ
ncbi:MAG TPA: TetR/AcrR family transcriptional regulator [Herpetosiphonaceae bacterium]